MTVNVGHSEVTVLMTVHLSDFHNKGNSHSSLSSFVKFQEHVDCGSRQIILNVVKVQQCTFAGPAHCQNQAAAPHHPNRYGLNCPAGPPQCQDQAAARHHPTATVWSTLLDHHSARTRLLHHIIQTATVWTTVMDLDSATTRLLHGWIAAKTMQWPQVALKLLLNPTLATTVLFMTLKQICCQNKYTKGLLRQSNLT